jgi:preprotein translocase subunit YajC
MIRTVTKTVAMAFAGLLLSTTLATAGGMKGTVTAVDNQGMATVKTEDGKEYRVRGEGWKPGAKVDCAAREGKTECKATQ